MMTPLSHYMDPELIAFLSTENREETLRELILLARKAHKLDDAKAFYEAIIEREKIVSTGIGMGVAIPHAKLLSYDQFFIAIGILRDPIDWHALDGAPVRLVFMIGGPDDKQTEYLQLLSSLTQAIRDEHRRKQILDSQDREAVIELFKDL